MLIECPICHHRFEESEYLKTVILNPKTLFIANLVTHYRHNHIISWNKCWGYRGRYYRHGWFGNYEEEKEKVNERAKRQILRKAKKYLIENGFTLADFMGLQHNSAETIILINKILK